MTQPSDGIGFLSFANRNTGQFNGVGAIAITNLKQRSRSHLKHFSRGNRCHSTTQQQKAKTTKPDQRDAPH
jgi:hypothetical protein